MTRLVASLLLVLSLTGCAMFYPEVADNYQAPVDCELSTKALDLKTHTAEGEVRISSCNHSQCMVQLAVYSVVPVGSFIVSGSIVLVGNTAHWLEKQGRCEDSAVQSSLSRFRNWIADSFNNVINIGSAEESN